MFVTDLNDNPPRFLQDSYVYRLEDALTDTLPSLNATDIDAGVNAEFEFGLHGVTRVSARDGVCYTANEIEWVYSLMVGISV